MVWKYTVAWIPMVAIAIANGTIRQFVYGQWVSERTAHQISCATGIFLFFLYTFFLSARLPLAKARQAWLVGFIWLCLTIAFEFTFGYFVAGHSLERLLQDYNIASGRLWLIVLAAVFFLPYATYKIRQHDIKGAP